jgi:hypothetical protein
MNSSKTNDYAHPWDDGSSIMSALRAWDGQGAFELPDEKAPEPNQLRFASGAWDGIATHHMRRADEHSEARVVHGVISGLKKLCQANDDAARVALYQFLLNETVVAYADTIVEELTRQEELGPNEVRPHARWLVQTASHREPLKLGLLLLGLAGTEEDLDDIKVLARHDEFTLYAAVAAANLLQDPVDVWWEMAQTAQGWGKIQVVERLSGCIAERPDIQAWVLRHGCANEVMPEYLAYRCALAGDLAGALAEDEIDEELLEGAGLIVGALLRGGPAEDMDSYEEGVTAVRHLLRHLAGQCDTLGRLNLVKSIHDWLEWPEPPQLPRQFGDEGEEINGEDTETWPRREEFGWTEEMRAFLGEECQEILGRPGWPERIRAAFGSADSHQRHLAWELAPLVGVDLWGEGFAQLKREPLDSTLYGHLLGSDDPVRLRQVIAFAEKHLPLEEVATGPDDQLGFGPEYQVHDCLDFLVQAMRSEGVFSDSLLAAALRSPVVRNRNMAITALQNHPVRDWGARVRTALHKTVRDEPDEELREKLRGLIAELR